MWSQASCFGELTAEHAGPVVAVRGLSCLRCVILVPQLEIEPESPALEGGFLITGPPGKSPEWFFLEIKFWKSLVKLLFQSLQVEG